MNKQLYTRWSQAAGREDVLSEYPRPQFIRDNYTILNGYWDHAVTSGGEEPEKWDGRILVPFSPESVLSGVSRQTGPDEVLWVRRNIRTDHPLDKKRLLLHFGAVDQSCEVFINDKKVTGHTGGYTPFSCDITPFVVPGDNVLTVKITDESDTSWHARGKQKLERGGMYYTATSGIWQSVWMEEVPEGYIESIDCQPDADADQVAFRVKCAGKDTGFKVTVFDAGIYAWEEFPAESIFKESLFRESRSADDADSGFSQGGVVSAVASGFSRDGAVSAVASGYSRDGTVRLEIPDAKHWSPEKPFLYYCLIECGDDRVISYFGLRTISVEKDERSIPRIMLDHRPVFMRGVLDQGYWPDGLLTPPSDEAYIFDIDEMKKTGFNMVRKHAKTEAERWYYHCDRKGIFVWQDMVNGGTSYKDWYVTYLATFLNALHIHPGDSNRRLLSREDSEGRLEFERDMEETVRAFKDHPSIVVWVLFNEGWGQFDTKRLTKRLKELDPSRLVDSTSGWYDCRCGDFISIHHYYGPFPWRTDKKRAVVISEFGGYVLHDGEHSTAEKTYGYRIYEKKEELEAGIRELIEKREKYIEKGLCAWVYTQWSDIEDEENGIYTYDREVRKAGGPFTSTGLHNP